MGNPQNVAVHNTETDLAGMPLSRLLAVAGHVVAIRWRQLMDSHGLTPHGLAVLAYLEQGNGLTQRELARRCGVVPSTLNHTVDHLERSGWIERHRDQSNRRLVQLALTGAGQRQLTAVQQSAYEQMEPMLDRLSAADEPIVRRFLIETVTRIQRDDSTGRFGYPGAEP